MHFRLEAWGRAWTPDLSWLKCSLSSLESGGGGYGHRFALIPRWLSVHIRVSGQGGRGAGTGTAHTPILVKWAIERQGRGLPHPDDSDREPTHARSVYRSITQFTLCDAHQPPIGMKASALAGANVWIALASYEAQTQLGTRRRP